MTSTFSIFSTSLLFNYWNPFRDSVLIDFLQENIPFILSENTGYTAYSGIIYNEEKIERQIKSIFLRDHPHFKSTYYKVSFSLLVKMYDDKCIGHDSAQVSFFYETNEDLNISLNDLKAQYLGFPDTKIVNLPDKIVEIKTADDKNWPNSVFIKIERKTGEYALKFSAAKLFF